MRFLVDEDISYKTANFLADIGYDARHVRDVGLKGKKDEEIIEFARANGLVLITMDSDFSDIRKYPPGTHSGIIRVRLRYPSVPIVNKILKNLLIKIKDLDIKGCLVVVDSYRFRIKGFRKK